ncbi:MAG: Hint domain-containing protein [Marinovum sp.]|nr:Hint domain-containing protein [Marinovum sp.]
MTVIVVTPDNWNVSDFWSGLDTDNQATLDLSGLGGGFSFSSNVGANTLTICDGETEFSVGGSEAEGTDANLGSGHIDHFDNIIAPDGHDTVETSVGDDIIDTGDGDDEINAGSGDDVVDGGLGDDTIYGGSGDDVIDAGNDGVDVIAQEDFSNGSEGWTYTSNGTDVNENDSLADGDSFMGNFSGQPELGEQVQKAFDLTEGADHAVIKFDFLKLDSWDNSQNYGLEEQFGVFINGEQVFSYLPGGAQSGEFDGGLYAITPKGGPEHLGMSGWTDQKFEVRITLDDPGEEMTLGFGAKLNQSVNDESWGIDNVEIYSSDDPDFDRNPGQAKDDDYVNAGSGDDDVSTGMGDDIVKGGSGDDEVHTGDGADSVNGGLGDDCIHGGGGDDVLHGGYGTGGNLLTNGELNDDSHTSGWTPQGDQDGWTNDQGGIETWADGFLGFSGGDGGTIVELDRHAGQQDNLYQDIKTEEDQEYTIEFDAAARGGAEGDSVEVYWNGEHVGTVKPDEAGDFNTYAFTVTGTGGMDRLEFREDATQDNGYGPLLNDISLVASDDDTIDGAEGDDMVDGGVGDDDLDGGEGNDTLDGGSGDDAIDGGHGDDVIDGGSGNDSIDGGAGADTISTGDGNDTVDAGDGADVIQNVSFGDIIDGGSGGDDFDTLDLTGSYSEGGSFKVIVSGEDSDGNGHDGIIEYYDADGNFEGSLQFANIEKVVPCFLAGTQIQTQSGYRSVETLRSGDLVLTRDNGFQKVRWIAERLLTDEDLRSAPHLQPICIAKDSLGAGAPHRDLWVSPQHRMLINNVKVEVLLGSPEVLVAAGHLLGNCGVSRQELPQVRYVHVLFERHEIVLSEGAWSESFQPGELCINSMDAPQREELFEIFPQLEMRDCDQDQFQAARPSLKRHEAAIVFAQ